MLRDISFPRSSPPKLFFALFAWNRPVPTSIPLESKAREWGLGVFLSKQMTALAFCGIYALQALPVPVLISALTPEPLLMCTCGCNADLSTGMGCCCGPGAHDPPDYSDGSTALECESEQQERLRPSPRKPHMKVDPIEGRAAVFAETASVPYRPHLSQGLPRLPEKIPII